MLFMSRNLQAASRIPLSICGAQYSTSWSSKEHLWQTKLGRLHKMISNYQSLHLAVVMSLILALGLLPGRAKKTPEGRFGVEQAFQPSKPLDRGVLEVFGPIPIDLDRFRHPRFLTF